MSMQNVARVQNQPAKMIEENCRDLIRHVQDFARQTRRPFG